MDDDRNAIDDLDLLQQKAGGVRGFALLGDLEQLLQFLLVREQGFDLLFQLMHGRVDLGRNGLDELQLLATLGAMAGRAGAPEP